MANRLSKSRFQTGLQCPKALWLTTHARELADPIAETQQHIFDTGTAVGELARERFAGGVLVAEDYTQSAQALETTRRLLEDPPSAIFEAALEHGGVFVRPDVLVRVGENLWDLYEVKSGTRVKDVNITDVAVQIWVLEGAGLPIRRAHLMHLDNTYVYEGGEYDLERLFRAEDVTEAARAFLPQVPELVAEMLAMLDVAEPPAVPIGKHCDNPYTCSFYDHCHAFLPDRPVTELPRISEALLDALIADGIFAIEDVPLDYPLLSTAQRGVCELVRSGEPRIVGDVAPLARGAHLPHPLPRLRDVHVGASALSGHAPVADDRLPVVGPRLARERRPRAPRVPLRGRRRPAAELHPEPDRRARRRPAASSSTPPTRTRGSTSWPRRSPSTPRRSPPIQTRLFDLLQTVRTHVRHPDCLGSSSIKVVLPALVDDLSYDGLGIADGQVASMRYLQVANGHAPRRGVRGGLRGPARVLRDRHARDGAGVRGAAGGVSRKQAACGRTSSRQRATPSPPMRNATRADRRTGRRSPGA